MPASGEYDEALLNAAPKIDKRTIQEGYSTDILNQTDKQPLVTPSRPTSTAPVTSPLREDSGPSTREPKSLEAQTPPLKKQPFYKTKKGLLIIGAVVVVIIVAAVVGGVVGSRKKTPETNEPTGGGSEEGGGNGNGETNNGGEQQGGGNNNAGTGTDGLPIPSISIPSLPSGLPINGNSNSNTGATLDNFDLKPLFEASGGDSSEDASTDADDVGVD